MADTSLVAGVESTTKPWTGIGMADSVQGLVDAVHSGSWMDETLAGVGMGLEVASTVLDPFGTLMSSAASWAMEHLEPLRELLNALCGSPDVVASHAVTWNNIADHLGGMATDLDSALAGDTPDWVGPAADSYQSVMGNNVDALGGLAGLSAALGEATAAAGQLVQFVHDIVRDLIADLVVKIIEYVLEACTVVLAPLVVCQVASAVVKWTGRIMMFVNALITSLTNLTKLLNG